MIKRYFVYSADSMFGPYAHKEEDPSGNYCEFSDVQPIAKNAAWCINLLLERLDTMNQFVNSLPDMDAPPFYGFKRDFIEGVVGQLNEIAEGD